VDTALAREALLERQDLHGRQWCDLYRGWMDRWLEELFSEGGSSRVDQSGVSLVAVGGYGRGDLCPHSDLDLLLLHSGKDDVEQLASQVWYPIWDVGLKLGHAVRTEKEALTLAADDLDTATALLHCRHLAGDTAKTDALHRGALEAWRKQYHRNLPIMADRVVARHEAAGEVAFLLEPDLKDGRGGLRDVHALQWLELARGDAPGTLSGPLAPEYDTLLEMRVELHRRAGRATDRLSLQEQDALVEVLDDDDADALMARVAAAGRTIAWASDEVWERVRRADSSGGGGGRRGMFRRRSKDSKDAGGARGDSSAATTVDGPLDGSFAGIIARDGEATFADGVSLGGDFLWTLRLAAAAAVHDLLLDRAALWLLAEMPDDLPEPWPQEARDLFAQLLAAGKPTIRVVEALDHMGLFSRLIPEWEPNRSRPQRNAYHRFTVDRHLLETAYQASKLTGAVSRPDLLVVGALLHDIGKGYPGDHTDVGMVLVDTIATRMGYPEADVTMLVDMVRHHLLLPDAATRRDLDDDQTILNVASVVGSAATLELLDALTEADSIATGPAAWGSWKAGLVRTLVSRTAHLLDVGELQENVGSDFPSEEHRRLMAAGELSIGTDGDTITVIAPDRPGLFSRVAGTLALHGLGVLEAQVDSGDGMAVEVVRVDNTMDRAIPWDLVAADLAKALDGRLALHARLVERAGTYHRPAPRASGNVSRRVTIDNEASQVATVIEVVSADRVALLYQVTQAMGELLLDIKAARVQTLGADVVDAFYVTDNHGDKITDPQHLAEIEIAITHSLTDIR